MTAIKKRLRRKPAMPRLKWKRFGPTTQLYGDKWTEYVADYQGMTFYVILDPVQVLPPRTDIEMTAWLHDSDDPYIHVEQSAPMSVAELERDIIAYQRNLISAVIRKVDDLGATLRDLRDNTAERP